MLFHNFLRAILAATIFASPYHDPRNQNNEVSDTSVELASLENNHHISEETVNSVIQNLKRGNGLAACALLQTNPKGIISSIIHKLYEEEKKKGMCTSVVDFIRSIDLHSKSSEEEPTCKLETKLIKSIAYGTLFYIISEKISLPLSKMSECVFRLAWDVRQLWLSLKESEWPVFVTLKPLLIDIPYSVMDLVSEVSIHIRRNSTPCKDVRKDILGDHQAWIGESYENKTVSAERGGVYFSLYDAGLKRPLEGSAEGNKVYLGQNDDVQNPNQLWKPVFVSDDELQFQHKGSGKYLSYEVNGSCYMYVLSDDKTNWYISTGA